MLQVKLQIYLIMIPTILTEGSTNQYHTTARARGAVSASGDLSYNSSTGVFSIDVEDAYTKVNFDSDLSAANTGQLPEGSNLYHTTARARKCCIRNRRRRVMVHFHIILIQVSLHIQVQVRQRFVRILRQTKVYP